MTPRPCGRLPLSRTWTSASLSQTRSPGDGVRRREPAIIESTAFYSVSFCRLAGSLSRAGDLINPSTQPRIFRDRASNMSSDRFVGRIRVQPCGTGRKMPAADVRKGIDVWDGRVRDGGWRENVLLVDWKRTCDHHNTCSWLRTKHRTSR
jgi:hypothetical protein